MGLGHGPRDASDDWNIVNVNVRWQELSACLLSARASGISKAIGLRASQHSQMWGSPSRTGEASRRLEFFLPFAVIMITVFSP